MKGLFVIGAMLAVLVGCASAGNSFKEQNLAKFEPGKTTFEEAEALLGAPAEQVVATQNGSSVAYWRHITANGVTGNSGLKQVGLLFSADGRFLQLVQYNGISLPDRVRQRLINGPDSYYHTN
ncbi:hypothetical protein [Pseudomonas tohonis]|uniref:hypothetical protein n=1 Tax=Pseudomonas tohonis TaxID=2725477 RepID=UPI001F408F9A|nr:hypothetical protein [Pseudomonas tohonis]